jgi:hypothetical protein
MIKIRILLSSCLTLFLLAACGGNKFIDYSEKLEGTWQLSNGSEVLKAADAPNYSAEELRKSTLIFNAGGKLETLVGKDAGTGTWKVSDDGSRLTLVADNMRFSENLALSFTNEKTIIITNTGKQFVFKKTKD